MLISPFIIDCAGIEKPVGAAASGRWENSRPNFISNVDFASYTFGALKANNMDPTKYQN